MAKVLIFSPVIVGKSMTGPAIRVWEFSRVLSKNHEVMIVAPNQTDLRTEQIKIIVKTDSRLRQYIKSADVLIAQQLPLPLAWLARRNGVKVIIDAYDPAALELLEIFKTFPYRIRKSAHGAIVANTLFNFRMADSIICASEKQRDLWLGFLLGSKLITLPRYDQDNSLRQFIDVVPFGLSSHAPKKTGPGLREKYGFSQSDKLIVWGGGIWDWFDPLSLVRAIKMISQSRSDIKLVFMGIKSPDPHKMSMIDHTIQLSRSLDLTDKFVFFNHSWVPYDERHNYLLDAAIGASTHFSHLETRFSFRTRMLDYIWAELPILATEGDSFAEMIQQYNLGIVVPYLDEHAIARAILSLINHPEKMQEMKLNLAKIQKQFYWNSVTQPLERMVQQLSSAPKKNANYRDYKAILKFLIDRGFIFKTKAIDKIKEVTINQSQQFLKSVLKGFAYVQKS